jgi:hypothetical protein
MLSEQLYRSGKGGERFGAAFFPLPLPDRIEMRVADEMNGGHGLGVNALKRQERWSVKSVEALNAVIHSIYCSVSGGRLRYHVQ